MDALPFTKSGCFPLGTERALLSRAAATLAVVLLSLSRALAADAISACAAALHGRCRRIPCSRLCYQFVMRMGAAAMPVSWMRP